MTFSSASRALALSGLVLTLAGCTTTAPPPAPSFTEGFTPIDPAAQVADMKRGVNVLGYDPIWRNPANARFTRADFKLIHDAGFSTVRVVLQSFDHMDANDKLDGQWLATLDTMVHAALDQGLTVILDEHDYNKCGDDLDGCKEKVGAFWSQIAPRYKDAPNRVIFEMLNEPHGVITPEIWNGMLVQFLGVIRQSNPTRNVIIGPEHWNGIEDLPKLELPDSDQHIIVTFHYYHPMEFTHQGAGWVGPYIQGLHDVPWGTDAEYALLNKEFDGVKAWSDAHHRPIFLGEFGAYDKAPMQYRVVWDSAVARAAEARGFAWAYWQFDPDFKLYDFSTDSFVEPILHALVPPRKTSHAEAQ